MKIARLAKENGVLEVIWVKNVDKSDNKKLQLEVVFKRNDSPLAINIMLPFTLMPVIVPGALFYDGTLLDERSSGVINKFKLDDLSIYETKLPRDSIKREHYPLLGSYGGTHRIFIYKLSDEITLLIPVLELIRYLFLKSRLLANSIFHPTSLLELAITPLPGRYKDIQIDFTRLLPRTLLTPHFIQEFAWISVDPDARKSWDSVQDESAGRSHIMFKPPPIRDCEIKFRGVMFNKCWLVLEILSLSGRTLPAEKITWTHPAEVRKENKGEKNTAPLPENDEVATSTSRRVRENVVDQGGNGGQIRSQDVAMLGAQRSGFSNQAQVVKKLREQPNNGSWALSGIGAVGAGVAKTSKRIKHAGEIAENTERIAAIDGPIREGGLPEGEFKLKYPATKEDLGKLVNLYEILNDIAKKHPAYTLMRSVAFLKPGKAISQCCNRRRACLVAVFISDQYPPSVLIDVDHTELRGLSALALCYEQPFNLSTISTHVQHAIDCLVDNHGRWDNKMITKFPRGTKLSRIPNLLRQMEQRAKRGDITALVYRYEWASEIINVLQLKSDPLSKN